MAQTIVQMVVMLTKSLVGRIKNRVPRFHRRVLFSNTSQKRKRRPQEIQQSHKISQLNHTDSKRPTYVLKELNETIGGVQNDIVRRINEAIQNKHR